MKVEKQRTRLPPMETNDVIDNRHYYLNLEYYSYLFSRIKLIVFLSSESQSQSFNIFFQMRQGQRMTFVRMICALKPAQYARRHSNERKL